MDKFNLFGWLWIGVAFIAIVVGNDLWAYTSITNSTVWIVGGIVGGELNRKS